MKTYPENIKTRELVKLQRLVLPRWGRWPLRGSGKCVHMGCGGGRGTQYVTRRDARSYPSRGSALAASLWL